MATMRRQAAGAGTENAVLNDGIGQEWDEATLLAGTGGLLTALPEDSSIEDWDMPALVQALKAGQVRLPLSEGEARRFRKLRAAQ